MSVSDCGGVRVGVRVCRCECTVCEGVRVWWCQSVVV